MKAEISSKRLAALAGAALADPKASKREKALAASVLTQAPDKSATTNNKPNSLPRKGQIFLHRKLGYKVRVTQVQQHGYLIETESADGLSIWSGTPKEFSAIWKSAKKTKT